MTTTTEAPPIAGIKVEGSELARAFTNAALFADSRTNYRPALAQLRLTFNDAGLTITATDSYALIRQYVDDISKRATRTVFIDAEHASTIAKAAKAAKGSVRLDVDNKTLTVTAAGVGVAVPINVDATYLNADALWPKPEDEPKASPTFTLSAPMLARIAKVKPDHPARPGRWDTVPMTFTWYGERKPCVIKVGNDVTILQMPCV